MSEHEQSDTRGDDSTEDGMIFSNQKRTYDAYQDLDLAFARRSQLRLAELEQLSTQAMQNAIQVANRVANNGADNDHAIAKQSIRHEAIATDRQWNSLVDQSADLETVQSESTMQDMVRKTILDVLAETGLVKAS